MHVRTMITSVLPEHPCPHDDNVVKLVGGDNLCENMAGTLKQKLRRGNKLGRCAKQAGAHIDALSALFVQEAPAMRDFLNCLCIHANDVQDTLPPNQAFVDTTWLDMPEP